MYYICMYVYLWHGEEWKLLTTATEHLNIMKQMHIDRSSSVCSAKCTNVAYISASVNTVKISILIVSRQRHSSWNARHCTQRSKLCYNSEWTASDDSARAAGNWTNHSNWFANRFTGLIKPLNRIDSKEWIIREWASLIAQRKVDGAFGINWSIFNLYCIKIK